MKNNNAHFKDLFPAKFECMVARIKQRKYNLHYSVFIGIRIVNKGIYKLYDPPAHIDPLGMLLEGRAQMFDSTGDVARILGVDRSVIDAFIQGFSNNRYSKDDYWNNNSIEKYSFNLGRHFINKYFGYTLYVNPEILGNLK